MPGLDLARGLAILMVLLDHGFAADQTPYQATPPPPPRPRLPPRLGHMGVHLFFILSGFLITGILLDSRTQPDYFRNFYTRRVLRIAPAYLLMVAVLFLTHSITARYLAVCLLCLCNMPGLLGSTSQYSALWSLSVEEQFYFVWPFIIRKLSRAASPSSAPPSSSSPPSSASSCSTARPPSRTSASRPGPSPTSSPPAPCSPSPLDYRISAPACTRPSHRSCSSAPPSSPSSTFFPNPPPPRSSTLAHATYLEPWLFGFSGFVLLAFLHPGIAAHIACRPLIFLAKISYGLYLCHPFLFTLVNAHWPLRNRHQPLSSASPAFPRRSRTLHRHRHALALYLRGVLPPPQATTSPHVAPSQRCGRNRVNWNFIR